MSAQYPDFIEQATRIAREEALAQAAQEEAEGDDRSTLTGEALDELNEHLTAENWNRAGAVVFASDLSIILEADHDIEPSLDNILVLAKFIETGDVLP